MEIFLNFLVTIIAEPCMVIGSQIHEHDFSLKKKRKLLQICFNRYSSRKHSFPTVSKFYPAIKY